MAPLDGWMMLMAPGPSLQPLVRLEDVPVTLAGIASQHIQNAMAAAAAAMGVGIGRDAVVRGLRSFVLDPDRNPGRANLFELDGRVIVVDYAHNEAGMTGLVEICQGLRPPGGEIWLALGSAGDRSKEIQHGFGYIAARGADHVLLLEMRRYLRGADPGQPIANLRGGIEEAGVTGVPVVPNEIRGLEWMLERARPGDVMAITALAQRGEIFQMMDRRGAQRVGPARCRQLVRRARGTLQPAGAS